MISTNTTDFFEIYSKESTGKLKPQLVVTHNDDVATPAFNAASTFTLSSLSNNDVITLNPYTGYHDWRGNQQNPNYANSPDVYERFNWNDIQGANGSVYDWSDIDAEINALAPGEKFSFRVRAMEASGNQLPSFLSSAVQSCSGFTSVPDWDNPTLIQAGRNLAQAMAAKYDGHPKIAWIDLGILGKYGEWADACFESEGLDAGNIQLMQTYVDMFTDFFDETQLVLKHSSSAALKYAVSKGANTAGHYIGMRGDGFGQYRWHAQYVSHLRWFEKWWATRDLWKNAPILGEFYGSTGSITRESTFPQTIVEARSMHISTIGNGNTYSWSALNTYPQNQKEWTDSGKELGYKIKLNQVKFDRALARGAEFNVQSTISNLGYVPTYENWTYKLIFTNATIPAESYTFDSTANLKTVTPTINRINGFDRAKIFNDTFTLGSGMTAGNYNVSISITQPNRKNMKLYNQDTNASNINDPQISDGIYPIGSVAVGSGNTAPSVSAGNDINTSVNQSTAITGSATDDGLPNPPGATTVTWSKVSGPGNVTFGNANAAATTVTVDASGTYVLRLTGNDSALNTSDEMTLTVSASNTAPNVNAGSDISALINNSINLSGGVVDDGLPNPPAATSVVWTKQSGPGNVEFDDSAALNTTATIDQAGTYVLRLTASDGDLSAYDEITVTVTIPNTPPVVNAGNNISSNFGEEINLSGSVTDDGLPTPPGATSVQWESISGPGTVNFGTPTTLNTTATFSLAGSYTLRLTADDGESTNFDDVNVTIIPPNVEPEVNAGNDNTGVTNLEVTLSGSVIDDGLPDPPGAVTVEWSKFAGPGNVVFSDESSLTTTAVFDTAGVYTLRLSANDGAIVGTDDITIEISDAPVANTAPQVTSVVDFSMAQDSQAQLNSIINDDGLPNPPNSTTITWSTVSGPGSAAFSSTSISNPTVTFPTTGVYVIRISVSDGELTSTDDITVTVTEANQAPTVNAGSDTNGITNTPVSLMAAVSDDGLPNPPSSVTLLWTKISGPGTVNFTASDSISTNVTFSLAGTYVLRLTASDSVLSTADDITVTISNPPAANTAPQVTSVVDFTMSISAEAQLTTIINDDGLPNPPSELTTIWSQISGPGTAQFSDANIPNPKVSFNQTGTYVIRITVSDSELNASDDITITVTEGNLAPLVNAGNNTSGFVNNAISLTGSATDDGLPTPPNSMTYQWTKVSGPGNVIFSSSTSLSTNATFQSAGTYVIRFTASDGALTSQDELTVTISAAPVANVAPQVTSVVDFSMPVSSQAWLSAVVNDDGLPNPPAVTTISWSKISGPGIVTFTNSSISNPKATFSRVGTYIIRITVSDSELSDFDDVTVNVTAATITGPQPQVSGGGTTTSSGSSTTGSTTGGSTTTGTTDAQTTGSTNGDSNGLTTGDGTNPPIDETTTNGTGSSDGVNAPAPTNTTGSLPPTLSPNISSSESLQYVVIGAAGIITVVGAGAYYYLVLKRRQGGRF